jgi:uncharacterized membrane protein
VFSTSTDTLSLQLLTATATAAAAAVVHVLQTANDIIDRGYSAVYYLNSTGHYVLAASVLRTLSHAQAAASVIPTSEYEVDVPLER